MSAMLANSAAFWLAVIGGLAVLYLLLVLAFTMPRREPPTPYYWEGRRS